MRAFIFSNDVGFGCQQEGKLAVRDGLVDQTQDSTAKTIEFKNDGTYTLTYIENGDSFWVASIGGTASDTKTGAFTGTYSVENGGTAIIFSSPEFVTGVTTKWVGAIGKNKEVIDAAKQVRTGPSAPVAALLAVTTRTGASKLQEVVDRVNGTPQVNALTRLFADHQAPTITALGVIASNLTDNEQVKQALKETEEENANGFQELVQREDAVQKVKELADSLDETTSFEELINKERELLANGRGARAVTAIIKALLNTQNIQHNLRVLHGEMLTEFQKDGANVFVKENYSVELKGEELVLNSSNKRFILFDTGVSNVGVKNETFTFTK